MGIEANRQGGRYRGSGDRGKYRQIGRERGKLDGENGKRGRQEALWWK